jgi:hypothetical protein
MSGDSRSPRVGCGAAILRDSKLLLVKRKRPPERNHWGLPGGTVDWLEPVAAAVCLFVWRSEPAKSAGSGGQTNAPQIDLRRGDSPRRTLAEISPNFRFLLTTGGRGPQIFN